MIELKPLFTTQEQSKRLLKLGVPAETADLKFVPHRTFNNYDNSARKPTRFNRGMNCAL